MKPVLDRTAVVAECPARHQWGSMILPGNTLPQMASCPKCDILACYVFPSRFEVGQLVKAVAIPNGFPVPRPEFGNLIVTGIRAIHSSIPVYLRLTAEDVNNSAHYFEGPEDSFAPMS